MAKTGAGAIPTENVTVLFGRMDGRAYMKLVWCDCLQEAPPAKFDFSAPGSN